ncbi:hypothetical protein F4802DRAFT_306669 [Xylaria palmicola]|nr:hypothetical protein F4802DRAFT_306669 [Xylaria palmicola]
MAQNWHEAPELVPPQSLPEVYYPPPAPVTEYRGEHIASVPEYRNEHIASIPLKPYNSFNTAPTFIETPKTSYPAVNPIPTYDDQSTLYALPARELPRKSPRQFCGCPIPILVLSAVVATLLAAVIGLAVGTGTQANRANNAEIKLAAYLANASMIDRGCSSDPDKVSATRYTSAFYSRPTFKIFCNSDAPNPPLQSFFVGNFDDCMDACASYSAYTAGNFPDIETSANFTCSGVSFVTAWTNRTEANSVNAPGNCYLKPGPQNSTALTHPGGDTTVHAAILDNS